MSAFSQDKGFRRIVDANINRVKEGLRVCEEITRFILNNRGLSCRLKAARHKVDYLSVRLARPVALVSARQSGCDVGRHNSHGELRRGSLADLFWANIQRAKESVRVLEEFSKLKDKGAALKFKELRYKIYEIEKSSIKGILSLRHSRFPGCRRKAAV